MVTVALGQAFLIRRDFNQEVNKLQTETLSSAYHREDRPAPAKDGNVLLGKLQEAKKISAILDIAIEEANCLPNIVAVDIPGIKTASVSLNEARKIKMVLQAQQAGLTTMIQQLTMMSVRVENDYVTISGVQVLQQRAFKMLVDVDELKSQAKEIAKAIRSLDSLIQKADWSLMIEIPETEI